MKFRAVITIFCLLFITFFCSCGQDGGGGDEANLMVNGKSVEAHVDWQKTDAGILLDIGQFMEAVGGRFTPVYLNKGIVAQYGKRIGFAQNDNEYGMVQVQLCKMEPPSREDRGRLWAPLGFISAVLGGEVEFSDEFNRILAKAPAPQQIGDVVPAARDLANSLKDIDYTVQQGDINLSNAIEVCSGGYSPNANGNNAGFPYFCIQAPLPPDADHAIIPQAFIYSLREDEGLVIIGKTPPACDYFSYRSYFLNRCVSDNNPFDRRKVYTQLGDPVNLYNIGEALLYPGGNAGITQPFESFFILVSTPDRNLYEDVLRAVTAAGLDRDRVLLDVVDPGLIRLGNDDYADMLNFLHRFSNAHDQDQAAAYKTRPTLEILRLTPREPRQADFLAPFPARQRGSGVTEDYLSPAMDRLRQAIIDKYDAEYNIRELETSIWLGKTGAEAINDLEDVLGETRDTLYLQSEPFIFNQDSLILVYGVNHVTAPKSVYNNVSCYGAAYFNGFGGITNNDYSGNVVRNFPSLEGADHMDKLYVWKFARIKTDVDSIAVPPDKNNGLKGINNGDKAFMGFRIYVDPDSPDLIGPDPDEIIFDRAVLLTPKAARSE